MFTSRHLPAKSIMAERTSTRDTLPSRLSTRWCSTRRDASSNEDWNVPTQAVTVLFAKIWVQSSLVAPVESSYTRMMVPARTFERERERASSLVNPGWLVKLATFCDRSVSDPTKSAKQPLSSRKESWPWRRQTPVTGPMHPGQLTLENSHTSEEPGQWLVSSQKGGSAHRNALFPKCAPTSTVPRGQACIPLRTVLVSTTRWP